MKRKKLKKQLKKFIPDKYTLKDLVFLNTEAGRDKQDELFYDLRIYIEKELSKDELLEKAKKDYPEGTKFKCSWPEHNLHKNNEHISNGDLHWWESSTNTKFGGKGIYTDNGYVWTKKYGWASIVKKSKLMLGEHEVEIEPVNKAIGLTVYIIKCNGGQVQKEQWLSWYSRLMEASKLVSDFRLSLSSYSTSYNNCIIHIGCVKNVTIKQIQAITDKLNEL